uniref:Uncharacterized protein n=1 Tax=Heterorhabditis bacteriophora TaxID=37862 RepID=A0A1I7XE01_HETBA
MNLADSDRISENALDRKTFFFIVMNRLHNGLLGGEKDWEKALTFFYLVKILTIDGEFLSDH